jgi:nucleotide-binding universal stress UspA family protein
MLNKTSNKIVCPIRGGTSSRYAEELAVELAEERGSQLVFVHVIDPTHMQPKDAPLSDAVLAEMEYMGESFLCIAFERARTRGIKAERVVLHGPMAPTLEKFLVDSHASTLVIGSPDHDAGHGTFSREKFDRFVEHVWNDLRIDVVIV